METIISPIISSFAATPQFTWRCTANPRAANSASYALAWPRGQGKFVATGLKNISIDWFSGNIYRKSPYIYWEIEGFRLRFSRLNQSIEYRSWEIPGNVWGSPRDNGGFSRKSSLNDGFECENIGTYVIKKWWKLQWHAKTCVFVQMGWLFTTHFWWIWRCFVFFHLLGLARCSELDSVCDLAMSSIYSASIYGCILHIRKDT